MERSELVKTCLHTAYDAGVRITDLALHGIDDRIAWEGLAEPLREALVRAGEEALSAEWPVLPVTDYMDFMRTGNRVRFENKYFPRRRMLSALVLAECAENRGRFLDGILDGLYLILEETSWCLPAHNSHVRDGQQEIVPDAVHPVVDLFAAETGAVIAVTEALLRPVLAEVSPLVSETVNSALRERIFEPFAREHFWWKGDGAQKMCNWTPWIIQNVLLAVLTRPVAQAGAGEEGPRGTAQRERSREADGSIKYCGKNDALKGRSWKSDYSKECGQEDSVPDEGMRRRFLRQAAASLDFFLDEYGEDGCCDEGAQYYGHAALTLFQALDIMDRVLALPAGGGDRTEISTDPTAVRQNTDADGAYAASAMAPVFADQRVRNIGDYIRRVHVAGPYYLNFADCSPLAGRRGAREYLFGKRTGNEALSLFAARDFAGATVPERLLPEENNLYDRLQQVFTSSAMLAEAEKGDGLRERDEHTWFESVGLFVARGGGFVLAAKAGDNGDSHNHNDVGSVILYRDGQPVLIDLGVGTYTRQTFSGDRYSLWFMQSQYHNLPSFRDRETLIQQKPGEEYGAASVRCGETNEGSRFLDMDIAPAYGDPRIRSYVRRVTLCAGPRTTGDVRESGAERHGEGAERPADRTVIEGRRADTGGAGIGPAEDLPCVIIEDRWDADLPAVLSFMTYEEPAVLHQGEAVVRLSVGSCLMELSGVRELRVETRPIDDERLGTAWKHDCFRILAEPAGNSCRIRLYALYACFL